MFTELENAVRLVDPTRDALYAYNSAKQKEHANAHPWRSDPNHFKSVRISAVALLKMVMHARSGGTIEVMGLMTGSIEHETFIVTDAIRLPVEGTETRVNAADEANEYIVRYLERNREVGRAENAVGWYHSHPGYGCWLSGIDVATQFNWQSYQDPFVAIVIDPDRTVSAGKVEIGAFRTFPEGYTPEGSTNGAAGEAAVGNAAVPLAKAADFGAHANRYYSLEVEHFKSSLDNVLLEALWNKYWVQTLSASPLFTNRDYGTKQMEDLAGKIDNIRTNWKVKGSGGMMAKPVGGGTDQAMDKVVKAAQKIAAEERTGLMAADVKEKIFGIQPGSPGVAAGQANVPTAEGEDVQMQMQEAR